MGNVYSTAEEAEQGVDTVVNENVIHWSQQVVDALKNRPNLKALVARIFKGVKAENPEAKWKIVGAEDDDGWEMTIFSNASSSTIRNITRPIIALGGSRVYRILVLSMSLEEAEHEG